MACDEYVKLEAVLKYSTHQAAFLDAGHAAGKGKRAQKQGAKAEREKASKAAEKMHWHTENCEECKAHDKLPMVTFSCDNSHCRHPLNQSRETRVWYEPGQEQSHTFKCFCCGNVFQRFVRGKVIKTAPVIFS